MSEFALENLMCHRDNLEHVLDSLKEGIIAHDMSRRIFFFNQEAERISGYNREDVLAKTAMRPLATLFAADAVSFVMKYRIWLKIPSIPFRSQPEAASRAGWK